MVKVANIKVEELDYSKTASYKKCLGLVPNLPKLLPKRNKIRVSFELKDTVTDLANAIRRVLINELPAIYLDYDEFKDLDTSDPYILCDFMKKQIEMLPIMQNLDEKNVELELHLENKTTEIIDVKTDHFIVKKGPALDKIVTSGITICRLRPGEYITIKNIHIARGIGKTDPGKFEPFSNVYYEPLIAPLDEKSGTSSLVSNPTHFLIKYTTRRNVESGAKAKEYMKQVCSILEERLKIIATQIELIPKADYYSTDILELETKGSIKEIQIKNEKWTLINLICRYCYILTKGNIKFITSSEIHPEVNSGIIRINHPEYKKLLLDAIKKIFADLKTISSAF